MRHIILTLILIAAFASQAITNSNIISHYLLCVYAIINSVWDLASLEKNNYL